MTNQSEIIISAAILIGNAIGKWYATIRLSSTKNLYFHKDVVWRPLTCLTCIGSDRDYSKPPNEKDYTGYFESKDTLVRLLKDAYGEDVQLVFENKPTERYQQTSRQDVIRRDFTWGRIIEIHTIGDFDIVEYATLKTRGVVVTKEEDGGRGFCPYVDGKDTNHEYQTLDKALVCAIAVKMNGWGAQNGEWAWRLLEPKGE